MEERAMTPRALIDASSAILLFKAGLIEPCCEAFRLRMTRSVFDEVTVTAQPGAVSLRKLGDRQPGVTILDDPAGTVSDNAADVLRLHRGERDTLIADGCRVIRFLLFLAVFIALAATQHLWSHGPRSAEDRILHFLSTTAGV
jgi:hypothetical protein